jgi:P2-related tail formation protein
VVTLAAKANGMFPAEACAWLAWEFKVDLPERPDSWFKKQDRQARIREALEEEKRALKLRRLFRVVQVPIIEHLTPPSEVEEEVRRSWARVKNLPL